MIGTCVESTIRGLCPVLQSIFEQPLAKPFVFAQAFYSSFFLSLSGEKMEVSATFNVNFLLSKRLSSGHTFVSDPWSFLRGGFLIGV